MPSSLSMQTNTGPVSDVHERQRELQVEFYDVDPRHTDNWRVEDAGFSPYWPGRGSLVGDAGPLLIAPPDHSPRTGGVGGNGTIGFSGVARDGNNTPVGGMTVRLYRTSDSLFVNSVVSNADGSYNISTPYPGEDHFIVCHKAGSPEMAGASQTTMQPW